MRVHLFGGVLAYDYMLAGWLRQRGVDAHYFFNYKGSEADYPWWEDASFDRSRMPEWCHFYPFRLPYFLRGPLPEAGRRFVRDFNDGADVQLVIGDGALMAHHWRRPFVVWSAGFEVEWAAPARIGWSAIGQRLRGEPASIKLRQRLHQAHVARQLRRANAVVSVMEFQVPSLLRAAGVIDNVVSLPMLYDCTRYQRLGTSDWAERYAGEACVFFLPTRHSYGSRSSNDKGADKVIRAFARLIADGASGVRLLMVEKGERLADSQAAVESLGISAHVDWLPHLTKAQLKHVYSVPNLVVLDQFPNEDSVDRHLLDAFRRFGARGSIFAEAMSMGCPVITNAGTGWVERARPPMVWNALYEREIVSAMQSALATSLEERRAGGAANRAWAVAEHHWESRIGEYTHLLESVARTGATRA